MVIILRGTIEEEYNESKLVKSIMDALAVDGLTAEQGAKYLDRVKRFVTRKRSITTDAIREKAIQLALEQVSTTSQQWDAVARNLRLQQLYSAARKNRQGAIYNEHKDSLDYLITKLVHLGVYAPEMKSKFTFQEICTLQKAIIPKRDKLLNYAGLTMLADRYNAQDNEKGVWELPQERWMAMSMFIHQDETKHRIARIIEGYEELSQLNGTMATPTMGNAAKAFGQLSSCFIDTLDDSLEGIYFNNVDVARLSKAGGGLGVYAGNIRALGAPIRGYKGASGGVVP
ncbi:ribonucleotide reductase large subunit [Staphylococcus phage MVC_VPHSA2]|uniref:Ribonucleoside-diphosphate reductase n=1 Tax=Staphylococcus phage MVC_VPHSA1 TaxID=3088876 RepID=A0ABZ0QZ22_9CAUD|nr:ribonucleotide reductase large subunit [Staphylococcus phage MVC_VPHSA1]WPF65029.1 ribonucleotide reductase large subunit [Staphylococcus phage MVC_VPHSA2]